MSAGKATLECPAPGFTATAVVNEDFKDISLSDYLGKYVALFFYPLDFSYVCPSELVAFSERADEFRQIDCELIACSTDSQFSHLAWIKLPRKEGGLGKMKIPLLADTNHNISRDYGVLLESAGYAYRGLFIIDRKGILRQISINGIPVGRSVDETLRSVQALQTIDEHGEGCPVEWRPGDETIPLSIEGSKEYFRKC